MVDEISFDSIFKQGNSISSKSCKLFYSNYRFQEAEVDLIAHKIHTVVFGKHKIPVIIGWEPINRFVVRNATQRNTLTDSDIIKGF